MICSIHTVDSVVWWNRGCIMQCDGGEGESEKLSRTTPPIATVLGLVVRLQSLILGSLGVPLVFLLHFLHPPDLSSLLPFPPLSPTLPYPRSSSPATPSLAQSADLNSTTGGQNSTSNVCITPLGTQRKVLDHPARIASLWLLISDSGWWSMSL